MSLDQKTQIRETVRVILEKGKPINDIIFMSKKMGMFDIAMMLKMLRPTKGSNFFDRKPKDWYGWEAEKIYGMVEGLGMGGDYLDQLLFGCMSALDVYTEEEIMTVLEAQREWSKLE